MTTRFARTAWTLAALALAACAPDASSPSDGLRPVTLGAWDDGTWRPLDMDTLADRIAAADVVLLGERHDNPDHHRAQAEAIAMARRTAPMRAITVVFEMLDRDQQPALDAYAGDAAGFEAASRWVERGWPARIYRPLFEAAFEANARLRAGDLDAATIRAVAREGIDALPEAVSAAIALQVTADAQTRSEMRRILADAHCDLLPDSALGPMVAVQRARDAALAEAVWRAHASSPDGVVFLIAGAGHIRNDHGVGALLRAAWPDLVVLAVGLVEADAWTGARPDIASFAAQYDVVWITRTVARDDPCEALRRRLDKSR